MHSIAETVCKKVSFLCTIMYYTCRYLYTARDPKCSQALPDQTLEVQKLDSGNYHMPKTPIPVEMYTI